MTGYLWVIVGFISLGMTTLRGMASEEIRDRLDHLPHAILRLAARRLDPCQRITVYQDEWLPELTYILKEAEARPITRLINGTRFALGILASAHRIALHMHRGPNFQPLTATSPQHIIPDTLRTEYLAKAAAISTDINLANGDTLIVPIGEPQPDGTQLQAVATQLSQDRRLWTLKQQPWSAIEL
jgi:hypothetical protein